MVTHKKENRKLVSFFMYRKLEFVRKEGDVTDM